MRPISILLTLALLTTGLPAQTSSGLQVLVLEGDGATNSLEGKKLHPVTILVTDADKKPVDGATVSLILPASGAGGSFSGINTINTKQTGREGRVVFAGMDARRLAGTFKAEVRASSGGLHGATSLTQTNAEIPGPAHSRWTSRRTLIMVAIIAGGAAAGIATGLHNADGSGKAAGYTVTPGSPTVTAPR